MAKKKARPSAATRTPKASKNPPNKSEAIRAYYKSHPNAKPKEVAVELKKKGISVSTAFVSTIRSTSKKKGSVGKPGRPPGRKGPSARTGTQEVSIDSLLKVKQIVEEMGGISETRVALTALEKLMK